METKTSGQVSGRRKALRRANVCLHPSQGPAARPGAGRLRTGSARRERCLGVTVGGEGVLEERYL